MVTKLQRELSARRILLRIAVETSRAYWDRMTGRVVDITEELREVERRLVDAASGLRAIRGQS